MCLQCNIFGGQCHFLCIGNEESKTCTLAGRAKYVLYPGAADCHNDTAVYTELLILYSETLVPIANRAITQDRHKQLFL